MLHDEFPELDRDRLKAACERAVARAAAASLDTEGYQVVNMHLARVEATEESEERATILRELSDTLEQRGDAERALVTRLAAFSEVATAADLDPLLRLARVTQRWSELPLESMTALVDIHDAAAANRLRAIADAWQHLGRGYHAADCLERVLLIAPEDEQTNEALEVFYRAQGEWSQLLDLLGRRAVHVDTDKERAELYREIAEIHDRELGDDAGALDAYQEANRLDPDRPEVLEAIARLALKVDGMEDDALAALERVVELVTEPKKRAGLALRAAQLATSVDWDKTQKFYERALADDPDLAPVIDGFAILLRDKGLLSEAVTLLINGADRPGLASERSRWLTDAADYCVALGDTDWAKQLYKDARTADPTNNKAGVALVELCRDAGSLVELIPILDDLCRTTDDPSRLRGYLIARSKVAAELGDRTGARSLLARAVELDPADLASKRELADMLFEAQQWDKARAVMEALFEHEDLLGQDASIELHYRVARCARELGDLDGAKQHASIVLAIAPEHRPSLLLREELDHDDPIALTSHQLALANLAGTPEEKAQRFTALGDRYIELGDRATAREMYREALVHRPGDHLLLTKFLELIADEGDWSYSLDLVQRLMETEKDPRVRARYGHLAGMIARDEMQDEEMARRLFERALEDDPLGFAAADELEALLDATLDRDALASFYYRRLEHVRHEEGRAGERLRLWEKLGELLMELDRHDDAIVAFEVALTLDPDNQARRRRLADLYDADPRYDGKAIALHQDILSRDKGRLDSYKVLHVLYDRTGQPDKARAVDDALAVLEAMDVHVIEDGISALFHGERNEKADRSRPARQRLLANEDWLTLSRIDVDLQLSALFALVTPAFAAERARIRPPPPLPGKEDDVPGKVAAVLANVAQSFGVPRPPVYIDRAQVAPCTLTLRLREGALAPVLFLGRAALDELPPHALAFLLARQLADLRVDRIARLLVPRAGELAQIVESAIKADSPSTSAKWLTSALHPVELDQVLALGARLRDRNLQPLRATAEWLAATERAADRIGFVVVGDLANCVRVLERDPDATAGEINRVLELVWSSITDAVLAVRARVEGWDTTSLAAAAR
ncbi:MAG: tetratricopeptide repeat protein [Acidobacteriota bacterium]